MTRAKTTMLLSVFTPSHNPRFLDDCYESLKNQTFENWEWIVVLNGAAGNWKKPDDDRVHLSRATGLSGVGAAKKAACELAKGEILVEFDHDDILVSTCLQEVHDAFKANPGVALVYSDFAQVNEDLTRNDDQFDAASGWIYTEEKIDGKFYLHCHGLEASPHNVSYVWFAPNHVRAFRRDVYESIGGYNAELEVLDDQELMCRMYIQGDFFHIEKCLYFQRMHPRNTQRDARLNARIQRETVQLYDAYVEADLRAWSARNGLLVLDLGAAHNKPDGYLGVDQYAAPGVDFVCDMTQGIDLADSSVGVLRAVDFLEHVPDKVALFNELYRLLAHGGMLISMTPSTDGRGAFQDPTHVSYYNENSFWYFTEANYAAFVPPIKCKFQVSRLLTFFPSPWHEEHNISYICANLIAIKDGPRQGGLLNW